MAEEYSVKTGASIHNHAGSVDLTSPSDVNPVDMYSNCPKGWSEKQHDVQKRLKLIVVFVHLLGWGEAALVIVSMLSPLILGGDIGIKHISVYCLTVLMIIPIVVLCHLKKKIRYKEVVLPVINELLSPDWHMSRFFDEKHKLLESLIIGSRVIKSHNLYISNTIVAKKQNIKFLICDGFDGVATGKRDVHCIFDGLIFIIPMKQETVPFIVNQSAQAQSGIYSDHKLAKNSETEKLYYAELNDKASYSDRFRELYQFLGGDDADDISRGSELLYFNYELSDSLYHAVTELYGFRDKQPIGNTLYRDYSNLRLLVSGFGNFLIIMANGCFKKDILFDHPYIVEYNDVNQIRERILVDIDKIIEIIRCFGQNGCI